MTSPGPPAGDAIAAALLQITQHAERLALLDDREAQHYQQIAERLREIATQLSDMSTRVHTATGTITDQAAVLASLDGLDEQVAAIAAQLADLHPANSGRASSWSIRAASTSETLSPMGTRAESGRLGRAMRSRYRGCAGGSTSAGSGPPSRELARLCPARDQKG